MKKKDNWFHIALRWKGSVVPEVLPRSLLCGLFGVVVYLLHILKLRVSLPIFGSIIPNIVLGLLLVFRTNTAYERFWEGRKAWGTLVNTVRNLSRQILVAISEHHPRDRQAKVAAVKLLPAFAIALKLHLRSEPINAELEANLSSEQFHRLKTMNHPPLEIAFWISGYLQKQAQQNKLDRYQLSDMIRLLHQMVDVTGICERILRTPIPLAYSIHLKQLLMIYSLSLPFQMVDQLEWMTGPIVALISFTLLGIEEIGIQIEDPFGHDANDLPLDNICNNMMQNIEDLLLVSMDKESVI
ncbi:bestrophin family ion channel [Pseudanabaena galeata UHCC 0370]|uniref:Bestrophin family ion channel n=1 Tax=Pseudanabaena galeata UHCC 0370 TaxID=3110310 RepID=A0ABU5TPU4_9CYAN|nr:bestrophin family ion channel [Pseudanabaena galeata]MEA5480368.1 bestrophin family ion channel [Pseudanabaena galeata UHCC 0370]